jgi:glycerophosphoryl diester phosphodiesterase
MPIERIAHRGARTELPENTLAAFERAFERGTDAIELDVHATRDRVVVVHHDPDLSLPVSAPTRRIAEMTWEDVEASRLTTGVSVPTLSEVLAAAPPRATVYVEIKGLGIETLVAEVLAASTAQCAVHSFDHPTIDRFKTIAPEVPRGLLFESSLDGLESAVRRADARDVWPHYSLVDATFVERTHALGCRVIAWTVNKIADIQRLTALRVDGICTDDVRILARQDRRPRRDPRRTSP